MLAFIVTFGVFMFIGLVLGIYLVRAVSHFIDRM